MIRRLVTIVPIPVFETDEGDLVAIGHYDSEQFLRAGFDSQNTSWLFDDFYPGHDPDFPLPDGDMGVEHLWCIQTRREPDPHYTWGGITESTPGALPITIARV